MSVRRFGAVSVALCVVGIAANASAQSSTSVHGVGTFSLAYTDNMLGVSSDPEPGQPGPLDVWYLEIAPGLAVIHDGPRAMHTFTYLHPFTIYLGHSDANEQSDVGAWHALFTLSPRDELTLGVTMERSNTRLANLQSGADQTTAGSQLSGDNVLLQAAFTQGYSREFSAQWSAFQSASFRTVVPLDVPAPQPNRYELGLGLAPEYSEGRNSYAVLGDATYFTTSEVNEGGVFAPSTAQVVMSGRFRWRHDLSLSWSTEVSGGFAGAMRVDPVSGGVWGPVGLGAIRYDSEGYAAALVAHRTLGPDLITAQTLMADHILLSGGVPVDRENHIVFQTGTGFSHSRTLQVEDAGFVVAAPFATPKSTGNQRLITTFNTWVLDASLGWYPEALPYVALRYQHLEQVGEDSQFAPATTFHRNLAMLTVGMMWPSREVPQVPQGPSQRVDGADRDDRILGGAREGGTRGPGGRPGGR